MFERLRAGPLFVWIVATLVLFAIVGRLMRPFHGDDLLLGQALTVALYLLPPFWLLFLSRKGFSDPAGLFPGHAPGFPFARMLGWLSISLVFRLFSLITLYGLIAVFFPGFVETWLLREFRLIVTAERTAFPVVATLLNFVLALILAPVSEEIVFRGVLLHRIWHKWGLPAAIIGTSLAFALLHSEFFGTFVLSLFLSLVYLNSRSLLYPIFFHFLNNAVAAAVDVADFYGGGGRDPLTVQWLQENWVRGLPFGLISLPIIIAVLRRHWPRVPAF